MACGANRQVRQTETKDAAEYHPAYAVYRCDLPMRNTKRWGAHQSGRLSSLNPTRVPFPVLDSSTILLILISWLEQQRRRILHEAASSQCPN